jgi:hypothetical protein
MSNFSLKLKPRKYYQPNLIKDKRVANALHPISGLPSLSETGAWLD